MRWRDQARQHVGGGAGRERHDDPDGAVRESCARTTLGASTAAPASAAPASTSRRVVDPFERMVALPICALLNRSHHRRIGARVASRIGSFLHASHVAKRLTTAAASARGSVYPNGTLPALRAARVRRQLPRPWWRRTPHGVLKRDDRGLDLRQHERNERPLRKPEHIPVHSLDRLAIMIRGRHACPTSGEPRGRVVEADRAWPRLPLSRRHVVVAGLPAKDLAIGARVGDLRCVIGRVRQARLAHLPFADFVGVRVPGHYRCRLGRGSPVFAHPSQLHRSRTSM